MTTEATAQELAQVFDIVKQRVEKYNTEKKQLADSLRQILASAQELLSQLGEAGVELPMPGRRGRPRGSGHKRRRPAKSTRTKPPDESDWQEGPAERLKALR